MRPKEFTVIDSTWQAAKDAGCDTCQLKYDGLAVQFVVANGVMKTLDMSGRDLGFDLPVDALLNVTLIGTFVPHTGARHIFDCWAVETAVNGLVDLRAEPYRSRYVVARAQLNALKVDAKLVTNHSILNAHALWQTIPLSTNVKGLVFRNSKDPASSPFRVCRWYKESPGELV